MCLRVRVHASICTTYLHPNGYCTTYLHPNCYCTTYLHPTCYCVSKRRDALLHAADILSSLAQLLNRLRKVVTAVGSYHAADILSSLTQLLNRLSKKRDALLHAADAVSSLAQLLTRLRKVVTTVGIFTGGGIERGCWLTFARCSAFDGFFFDDIFPY